LKRISQDKAKKKGKRQQNNKEIRKQKREQETKKNYPFLFEDPEEEKTGDKRKVNRQIEKNIGLKKKHKKQERNPRIKHRMRYEKAKKRRASQVQRMRDTTKRYAGEVTGINSRLVKSTKL